MSDNLARRIRERASLDEIIEVCRRLLAHRAITKHERARLERRLQEIEALRASKRGKPS